MLGIDLGARRIGVAIGDPSTGHVRPLATLQRRSDERDAASIARLAAEHGVTELVVGLPLLSDGSEGEQAAETRAWAERVCRRLGLPLTLRDERFTSVAAEGRLPAPRRGAAGGPPSPRARRAYRARIDREAAAAIIQAELDARAGRSCA